MLNIRLRHSWFALITLAIAAVACTAGVGDAGGSEEITRVEVSNRAVIYASLEELIDKSDAVVIGSFSGEKTEKVFPERDPNNWEQINPNYSSFGSVYYLTVERYLMGDGPNSLDFFQYEGTLVLQPSGKTLRAEEASSPASPPDAAQRYLLFIRTPEFQPEIVVGTALPWRFLLTDGVAKPDSTSKSILDLFPSDSEASFISRVEAVVQAR